MSVWKACAKYWLPRSDARVLAGFRILFYGWHFVLFLSWKFWLFGLYPQEMYSPRGFFAFFHLPSADVSTLRYLEALMKGAILFSAFGFLTPLSTMLAFLSSFYVIGVRFNYHYVHWANALSVIVMGILCLAPTAAVWSVDSWIMTKLRGRKIALSIDADFGWPIRLIQLMWVMVFFAAGLSKLREGGLNWVTSDTLSNYLVENQYTFRYRADAIGSMWLASWVASQRWLCHVAAGLAVFLEITSPLALFSYHLRRIIVPAIFLLQVGIHFLLYQNFLQFYFPIYFAWIPKELWIQIFNKFSQRFSVARVSIR